ncbi:hypothetical protein BDV37DRAFT_205515 [Aspergillus pseudonomiae]|uniref:Uncharacterized protein n=1 Tax=Aspergillus pseudonomiae TaxID=1506151 RepID=A0A5N7DNQ0_9EURO|nr:uncharacterized protein BDV37DRAFT_205515 [Aspergillus pseudonomiae]KAE8407945.1 hypothetical protein BDV37DRAFT_205515 [Aspergillus pseudonomiae]
MIRRAPLGSSWLVFCWQAESSKFAVELNHSIYSVIPFPAFMNYYFSRNSLDSRLASYCRLKLPGVSDNSFGSL